MSPSAPPSASRLRTRLPGLMLRDERRLGRRLDRARRRKDPQARDAALGEVAAEVAEAEARVERRRASVPQVAYPPELPVSHAREELLDALGRAQVVVVAGETGSGKTTQLPKLCLELGRGVLGRIGHTQPRRIAARSVAHRVADELDVEVGAQVGYHVRFTDKSSDQTLVKVMTDGIVLAEIQSDPLLRAYDTLIVDEAHERSLNIDFLLGYLQQLLPRRPDLKVVITSATIDVERFSRHFGDAPVVEVSGRTYPVEVRYRPLHEPAFGDDAERDHEPDDEADAEERDQVQGICDAVDELTREGPGDILVFLPGERDIRETAEALGRMELADTEVLPLYARLPPGQQQRVFEPHSGRRIVLATNVAETSLTVPGIRYVVDPGTARISRYSQRTKVQRLPIEPVSKASADQRAGRCGRVADGICIRLYSREDFEARPDDTEPEILRTNLASVVLQMTALGLGDVAAFPFLDPPDRRSVRAAAAVLHELGAVEDVDAPSRGELTAVGKTLARLPLDPRLGRMLVEGARNGCVREVLVIAAALSVPDPRQRPPDQQERADELHARFADASSDFSTLWNLWQYVRAEQRALSGSAFRRRCKQEFLHYLRIREWQDLHTQLRAAVRDEGMPVNDAPAHPDQVHRAVLAGLLSHIGMQRADTREYQGARGTRFAIWPGSSLAAPPAYLMAGELVETSRLWARTVARIEPEWAEELAPHLVVRTHTEPWWDPEMGTALLGERVTLFGVPLVADRVVPCAGVDPAAARDLFIRHALVEGDWERTYDVLEHNRALLAELSGLEARARRRDLLVDDEELHAFYADRVPGAVVSAAHFDAWWKDTAPHRPELLRLTREFLLGGSRAPVHPGDYPDVWRHGDLELAVAYRFDPGAPDDGVTVEVPLAVLGRVEPVGFDWQVPGLREELVTALVRGLPKELRRGLVPIPDVVRAVLPRLRPTEEPLVVALSRELEALTGVVVPRDAWNVDALPDHLRLRFRVTESGRTVAEGHDLVALQRELAAETRGVVAEMAGDLERSGQTTWTFGSLPRTVELDRGGARIVGFPALVDEGRSVGVRVHLTEEQQRRAMWAGVRRLLLLAVPVPVKAVHERLAPDAKLALTRNPHGSVQALLEDAGACAVDALVAGQGGPAWDAEGFEKLRAVVEHGLTETVVDVLGAVQRILAVSAEAEARLDEVSSPDAAASREDARAHLERLVHPGFVAEAGLRRLDDLHRYVRGIVLRVEKLRQDPDRDARLRERVAAVQQAYVTLLRRLGPNADDTVAEVRWMIEELRVSLFAEQLGTRQRVSEQRILRTIAELEG